MTFNQRLALAVSCVTMLLVGIDGTAVNIALVPIQHYFHAGLSELQWILNAYLLALAGFMVIGGRLCDLLGRKRMFLIGILLFGISSWIGGIAPAPEWIIASRVLQGIGGALLWPATMSIAYGSVPSEKKGSALGLLLGFSGLAMAIGPILAGLFIQHLSWRWIFYFNVPLSAALFLLAIMAVEESEKRSERIDYFGSALLVFTLVSLFYGLDQVNTWGWLSVYTLGLFLCTGILGGFFLKYETRVSSPLIDLELLGNRSYRSMLVVRFLTSLIWIVVLFIMALYFQHIRKLSALESGLVFLPLSIGFGTMSAFGGRIIDKIGVKIPTLTGLIATCFGLFALSFTTMDWSEGSFVLPFALLGFGQGLCSTGIGRTALGLVQPEKTGVASGMFSMLGLAGGCFGVAWVGLMLGNLGEMRLLHVLEYAKIPVNALQESILKGFLTASKSGHALVASYPSELGVKVMHLAELTYTNMLDATMFICFLLAGVSLWLIYSYNQGLSGKLDNPGGH